MPDRIKMTTSIEYQFDNSRYNQGTSIGDYKDQFVLDVHSGQRKWGGTILRDIIPGSGSGKDSYDREMITSYHNAVVNTTLNYAGIDVTGNYLDLSNATTLGDTLPDIIHFLAVERVSTLGVVEQIRVKVNSDHWMRLRPGEASAIHIPIGVTLLNVDVFAYNENGDGYLAGVNEASINIIIAGVESE